MLELTLIENPGPAMEVIAHRQVRLRREACVQRYGAGVRLVDSPRRPWVQLYRGRSLLEQALRPAQDARPPGLVDKVGWLLREARAWHTLAMVRQRPSLAKWEEIEAARQRLEQSEEDLFEPRFVRARAKQLRLLGGG